MIQPTEQTCSTSTMSATGLYRMPSAPAARGALSVLAPQIWRERVGTVSAAKHCHWASQLQCRPAPCDLACQGMASCGPLRCMQGLGRVSWTALRPLASALQGLGGAKKASGFAPAGQLPHTSTILNPDTTAQTLTATVGQQILHSCRASDGGCHPQQTLPGTML